MTRTKRIYNKRPLLGGPGLKGWIVSNRGVPEIMDLANDYVFRPHGYYCMGNCPSCKRRDKRDQKRKTARKVEVRQAIRLESEKIDWSRLYANSLPDELADLWYDYQFPYDDFGFYSDW